MPISIDIDKCNGCGLCSKKCPYGAMELQDGKAHVLDTCVDCGICVESCKQEAINQEAITRPVPDFSEYSGVWVVAEQYEGRLLGVAKELLTLGRGLADQLGQELCAVLLGNQVAHLAEELAAFGPTRIYLAEHPQLENYTTGAYTKALSDLIKAHKPNVLLIGATSQGRDLAPRLSARMNLGLTADCTGLDIDLETGLLHQTRPAFGGNIMATIISPYSRPQMATVRPGVFAANPAESGNRCEVVGCSVTLQPDDILTTILGLVKKDEHQANLEDAKIIVAGGRGLGSRQGMALVSELAEVLGGEVSGTRVAVENGWVPPERQIGQTGRSVRPELYIGCGISGALQHRVGILGSKYIVCINKDERAPLFQVADWGIIGDVHEVLPRLIKALKNREAGN